MTRLDFLTVDQAIKFYERCLAEKATTLEERLKILNRFQHETVFTERAADEVVDQLSKTFKVTKIEGERP